MIARAITPYLKTLAGQHPVVTVLGPRQSGKTTLVQNVFPDYCYVNLELPKNRLLAVTDPEAFFKQFPPPVIIDEIQRVPDLLSVIQVDVDAHKAVGRYVLTGSHQPSLRAGISQSLAGRTVLLTLLPLSIAELAGAGHKFSRDEYVFNGFLPRLYDQGLGPVQCYEDYYRTYVERDVRQLVNIADQMAFELFVKLLAGRVGQVVNMQGMSGEVGVSAPTLRKWLSVLEASYIVFRLQPYYNNFGKRLVKSPKVYFTDVGLAAHLLGIESAAQAGRDPLLGNLFENLVVADVLKARLNAGKPADLYYFRDLAGAEIDLVLDRARKLDLFEIKSAMTPDPSMARQIVRFRASVPAVESGTVIYAGEPWPGPEGARFVNFATAADRFG